MDVEIESQAQSPSSAVQHSKGDEASEDPGTIPRLLSNDTIEGEQREFAGVFGITAPDDDDDDDDETYETAEEDDELEDDEYIYRLSQEDEEEDPENEEEEEEDGDEDDYGEGGYPWDEDESYNHGRLSHPFTPSLPLHQSASHESSNLQLRIGSQRSPTLNEFL